MKEEILGEKVEFQLGTKVRTERTEVRAETEAEARREAGAENGEPENVQGAEKGIVINHHCCPAVGV